MKDELFVIRKSISSLFRYLTFLVIWKERNSRAFDRKYGDNVSIRDRWLNIFDSFVLGQDIYRLDNFGNVIDLLTDL